MMDGKFTREWRGKVKVEKITLGDNSEHYAVAFNSEHGWINVIERDPQTGNERVARFETGAAAMFAGKNHWTNKHKSEIVKRERVFG